MTTIHITTDLTSSESPVSLNLHLAATLAITAEDARHCVNRHVVANLGTGLIARPPELAIVGEQIYWRVPIALSLPGLGDLGQVGMIDIDAQTGNIMTAPDIEDRIIQHARRLYNGATLPAE